MGRLSKVFETVKAEPGSDQDTTKARKQEIVNVNFKVSAVTRRKLKQYAAKHDLSLKEVFEAALDFYIEHHP